MRHDLLGFRSPSSTRKAPAVIRFLGLGSSPGAEFHGWARWLFATHMGRGRAIASLLTLPFKAIQGCMHPRFRAPRRAVAERFGVTGIAQVLQCLWLRARYGFTPEDYYRFHLFRRERRRLAAEFVQHWEGVFVFTYLSRPQRVGDAQPFRDKRRFVEFCCEHGLRAVPTVATFEGGQMHGPSGDAVVFPSRDLFVKPVNLWGGLRARMLAYAGDGRWRLAGGLKTQAQCEQALAAESSEGVPLILQTRLKNHEVLRGLTPGGLCTIRLITARFPDGPAKPILATYRMPIGDSAVDTFGQGGLAAPIDLGSGELGVAARSNYVHFLERYDTHPTTGARIAGQVLPFWESAVGLAIKAHGAAPQIVLIGWDIAITDTGPVFLEANRAPAAPQIPSGVPVGATPLVAMVNAHLREEFAQR